MVGIRERLSQQNKNNVKNASFTPLWKGTYWLCSPCMEVCADTFVTCLAQGFMVHIMHRKRGLLILSRYFESGTSTVSVTLGRLK